MFFCEYSPVGPLALQTQGDAMPNYRLGLAGLCEHTDTVHGGEFLENL